MIKKPISQTFCVFKEIEIDSIDLKKPDFKSKSGSVYFYTNEGVYRLSGHWGRASRSKWYLTPLDGNSENKTKLGFANWNDFHEDNNYEDLYFIEVDFENESARYNHKNNLTENKTAILRTSAQTMKIIKQVRSLFENDKWTKYYDIENLKQKVINELVHNNKSLTEIKLSLLTTV